MSWHLTNDPELYAKAVSRLLESDPVRHTISLTVLAGAQAGATQGELWGWWVTDGGEPSGAVSLTPSLPLLVATMPTGAVTPLAAALADHDVSLPGVNAPPALANAFAAAWCDRTEATPSGDRRESRLYQLGSLTWPDPMPPGHARRATADDRDLLVEWWDAFHEDVGNFGGGSRREHAVAVDDRLSFGGVTLWAVDGEPVSLAGRARSAAGVIRIAPVYTPPKYRGRGYAAAVTAAATQAALDSGATGVCLFTDLANPLTNRLYPRVGYIPVEDRLMVRFG